jgi:hypothetical protein
VAHLNRKEHKVHAVHYQTKGDSKLRDFCGKLKPRGKPVTIRTQEEIFALFSKEDLPAPKIVIFVYIAIEVHAEGFQATEEARLEERRFFCWKLDLLL